MMMLRPTWSVLHMFAELTTVVAGLAVGLCAVIVVKYWGVFKETQRGARLLPLHVMGIALSYSMLAVVAVARLSSPPPPWPEGWWIYPFVTSAFTIGDASLMVILLFVSQRGARVEGSRTKYGRRKTDKHEGSDG